MNANDAKRLVKTFSAPYVFPYAKELPEMDSARWETLVLDVGLSYSKTASILIEFIGQNPPRILADGKPSGAMPDIALVKYFLESKTAIEKNCPCCGNTRWVNVKFEDSEYVTYCDCLPGDKIVEFLAKNPGAKKGWEYFDQNSEIKCIAFHCQPSRDNPCPLGIPYYNAKKVEFMKRMKTDPNYQLGLTFLKGKKVKNMIDELDEFAGELVEDIPEAGADEVPF